eukprot:315555-Chlamydomonas_euryale.AAC.4
MSVCMLMSNAGSRPQHLRWLGTLCTSGDGWRRASGEGVKGVKVWGVWAGRRCRRCRLPSPLFPPSLADPQPGPV